MRELALNILDIAENSLSAGAKLVEIRVIADLPADRLTISVRDDGCGMDAEMLARVTDPFTTSRTTRKVGMGIPLFKFSAESAGGSFDIRSEKGKGTLVTAQYSVGHVDRMPLGDFGGVVFQLVTMNPAVDFYVLAKNGESEGVLDTREMREVLGDIPLSHPEVRGFLKDYIKENLVDIFGGRL